jgi:Tfp pilus assembly protein FimT
MSLSLTRHRFNYSAWRRLARRRVAGFTLLEFMIVVLTLSIVVMLGLPMFGAALGDVRLSGAASEIVTALEFAQLTALNSGRETKVTIDDTADTILVEQFKNSVNLLGDESELAASDVEGGGFAVMGHPVNRGADYHISLANESRFNGVDITVAVFGSSNSVVFKTLGGPSDGGTVTLASGSSQLVVSVDSLTGKVTLSE